MNNWKQIVYKVALWFVVSELLWCLIALLSGVNDIILIGTLAYIGVETGFWIGYNGRGKEVRDGEIL